MVCLIISSMFSLLSRTEIAVNLEDRDANEAFFDPLQRLFDQCKAAKMIPRYEPWYNTARGLTKP